jgi:hypothetical protein
MLPNRQLASDRPRLSCCKKGHARHSSCIDCHWLNMAIIMRFIDCTCYKHRDRYMTSTTHCAACQNAEETADKYCTRQGTNALAKHSEGSKMESWVHCLGARGRGQVNYWQTKRQSTQREVKLPHHRKAHCEHRACLHGCTPWCREQGAR